MATTTSIPKKVAIIIGSTRAVRIGPSVASLIKTLIEESSSSNSSTTEPTVSLLDVASFHLPVFDEPILPATVPAMGTFSHDHTKKWNDAIGSYDGYIIVAAEYNFGMPGALKNAIDYLYHAWIGKPVAIVTYGVAGGKTAGSQLRGVLTGMHLRVVKKEVSFEFPDKDEKNRNMSPGLMAAMGGVLKEEVVEVWKGQKGEVVEAWNELKGLLEEGKGKRETTGETAKEEVPEKA